MYLKYLIIASCSTLIIGCDSEDSEVDYATINRSNAVSIGSESISIADSTASIIFSALLSTESIEPMTEIHTDNCLLGGTKSIEFIDSDNSQSTSPLDKIIISNNNCQDSNTTNGVMKLHYTRLTSLSKAGTVNFKDYSYLSPDNIDSTITLNGTVDFSFSAKNIRIHQYHEFMPRSALTVTHTTPSKTAEYNLSKISFSKNSHHGFYYDIWCILASDEINGRVSINTQLVKKPTSNYPDSGLIYIEGADNNYLAFSESYPNRSLVNITFNNTEDNKKTSYDESLIENSIEWQELIPGLFEDLGWY